MKLGKNNGKRLRTNDKTAVKSEQKVILKAIYENFKLQPAQIIEKLELDKPQFRSLASYGHFGRNDVSVKWEELDKVEDLKKYLN